MALVKKTSGASVEAVAHYIVGMVNDLHENGSLLAAAMTALEAITDEGLTFSTEQDADDVIRRIKEHGVGSR